jgi:tRNA-specific 2-thiouridylase
MAARWQLNVAMKAESQEICFIPDGDYRTFLRTRLGPEEAQPGQMVNTAGDVVGEHQGLPFYTVGQRRGLGVAAGQPLYVTQVQPQQNVLVVGSRQEAMSETFTVERLNWLCSPPPQVIHTTVQIRYRHRPVAARVEPLGGDRARIALREPQFAVTPGQAAVFYDGDTVMGGGWICREAVSG